MPNSLALSLSNLDWVVCATVVLGSILAGLYLSLRVQLDRRQIIVRRAR